MVLGPLGPRIASQIGSGEARIVTQITTQKWSHSCASSPRASGPIRWVFSNWKAGARAGLPSATVTPARLSRDREAAGFLRRRLSLALLREAAR
jgi:hypothetical protein